MFSCSCCWRFVLMCAVAIVNVHYRAAIVTQQFWSFIFWKTLAITYLQGALGVSETSFDGKKYIDEQLKKSCESLISTSTTMLVGDLNNFIKKVGGIVWWLLKNDHMIESIFGSIFIFSSLHYLYYFVWLFIFSKNFMVFPVEVAKTSNDNNNLDSTTPWKSRVRMAPTSQKCSHSPNRKHWRKPS